MDINMEIIEQGLTVMCVGFSVVFVFLSIMIVSMGIMGKIVAYLNKIFPVAQAQAISSKKSVSSGEDEIAVAIAAVLAKQSA